MRALLVSDTHRRDEKLRKLLERAGNIDVLFHMGDSEGNQAFMEELAGCPVYMVKGNCDFDRNLPESLVVDFGGRRFFVTHGHRYYVNSGIELLREASRENNADFAFFGHTHRPLIDREGGITVVNPGSLAQPRPYGSSPTYILMEIDDKKEVHFTLNEFF